MRFFRWALIGTLLAVLAVAIHQTWRWVWGNPTASQVKKLADGDQEIALIELATSIEDWGRLITALQLLQDDWQRINPALPALDVSTKNAFPLLTADVPEVEFSFAGTPGRLWLRWYKISGEYDAASWVDKLSARGRAPVAVIGGGTSDRAIRLARALHHAYGQSPTAPAFLMTTATADTTSEHNPLMRVYPGRSFRFSFTNQTMVASLLEFIDRRQYPPDCNWARSLWISKVPEKDALAWAVAGAAASPRLQSSAMHAFSWSDERYSQDMAEHFQQEFKKRYPFGEFNLASPIESGVGGFFQPSSDEQFTVGTFLARPTRPHTFLVLPTQTVRMRRFLINLRQRSPEDARNLIVLNGDAISFNAVYRDRDVLWNILDLPYSLVFFSHRNPVDREAGFRGPREPHGDNGKAFPPRGSSGTYDILLHRDIFEALLYAVHDGKNMIDAPGAVCDRLRETCWHQPADAKARMDRPRVYHPGIHDLPGRRRMLFDADGDRRKHTGEHIVWVKPNFTDDIVDLKSKISVWTVRPGQGGVWELVDEFDADYNQARLEGAP
jgi:hypothetical protein